MSGTLAAEAQLAPIRPRGVEVVGSKLSRTDTSIEIIVKFLLWPTVRAPDIMSFMIACASFSVQYVIRDM